MRILVLPEIPAPAAVAMAGLRQEGPNKERIDPDPLVDVVTLEPMTANVDRL